ncbi:MAG: A/G-specific adenine glycosylase [Janthinobacterium lividum]
MPSPPSETPIADTLPAAALLRWYDRHRRSMPWRALPGEAPDPYRVWLSEIMLQQTTVAAVIPYFGRFLARFPDVAALAAAPDEQVMAAWAGLGYYARARNLLACARAVVARGGFPADVDTLRTLPGIGAYTSAAVAAIAFGVPVVPVDGNVERVASRLFAIQTPLPASRPLVAAAAARLSADPDARARPSDFAQALFDLGATVCTPGAPACGVCPWMPGCEGRRQGIAATLPRKLPRKARPVRHGAAFLLRDAAGRVLLRRRPDSGLFGGMTELPGTPWRDAPWTRDEALAAAPLAAPWRPAGEVRHGLTHFELRLAVYAADLPAVAAEGTLVATADLADQALPSVMRRCVDLALAALQPGAPRPVITPPEAENDDVA